MTIFHQIAIRIIKEQERIIGPIAWSEAKKVPELLVVTPGEEIDFKGDPKKVIDDLVARYDLLFGRASHEVCKEVSIPLLATMSPLEIPLSLR